MNNEILVSVGISFYNSERYISDAIKSVLNQSYSNIELLMVDDGSTDSSLSIARKFQSKDSRVEVISDGKNLGLACRLNQLSALASGQYYARMDADDIMFPDRISEQVEYLKNNPSVDLLGSGAVSIDNDNNVIGLRKSSPNNQFVLRDVLRKSWTIHPTIIGKSKWFRDNPYDEEFRWSEDFELWARTFHKSSFVTLEQPVLFYREASTSTFAKYIRSTKYSIRTYWAYRGKIGYFVCIQMMLLKISKLGIYFGFSAFGLTDKLIQRRSNRLIEGELIFYTDLLKQMVG